MVLVNFRHITCTRAHVQIRNHGGIINGAAQGGEFENLTNSGGGDPLYTYITSSRRTVRLGLLQGIYERFPVKR